MKLDKHGEFIEAFVKGEIGAEEFDGWELLTYPRQLELQLGRTEYKLADHKKEEELTAKIQQLSNALTIGLVPVKAILIDSPGTTKYLCSDILQELQLFVDSAFDALLEETT